MNFSPESLREDSSADVKRKENVPPSQVTPPKKSPRLASLQDVLDHDPPPLVHQDPPHDDDNAVPPPVTNSRSSPPPPLVPQQHPDPMSPNHQLKDKEGASASGKRKRKDDSGPRRRKSSVENSEDDVIEVSSDNEEEDSPVRSSSRRSGSSSVLEDKFELCQFPPGEIKTTDSVTVCVQDYKSLEYDTFLNDIIIDFFLTYLFYEKLPEEDRSSVHIFSTMFYKRLTSSYKNDVTGLNSAEKKHARVKAWTKNVNLFEKKILVFPICYQNHWFLIIAVR